MKRLPAPIPLLAAATFLLWLLRTSFSREGHPALTARARKFHGREIFPGIGTPFSRTIRCGAAFVGVERGEVSTTLIGWVCYTPIFFKPGTECSIVGGRWLLISNSGLRYRGALRGSFGDGFVRWNGDAKLATISIEMNAPDGAGSSRAVGNLTGALNHLPFPPLPPVIAATFEPAG